MSCFADEVLAAYIHSHCPNHRRNFTPEYPLQIIEALYDQAQTLGFERQLLPRNSDGVNRADVALMDCAKIGDLSPLLALDETASNEIALRATFGITKLALEASVGSDFAVMVPAHAIRRHRQLASVLHILAGAGRSFLDRLRPV